jgi:hypothetical protein
MKIDLKCDLISLEYYKNNGNFFAFTSSSWDKPVLWNS